MNSNALRTKLAPAAIAFGALTGVVAAPLISVTAAVAADGQYGEYTVSTAKDSYTVEETANGVAVTVTNLTEGQTVRATSTVAGTNGSEADVATANADGIAQLRLANTDGFTIGTHTVNIFVEGAKVDSESPITFEVTEAEDQAAEPTASLSAETISADEFVNEDTAIRVSGQDFPAGDYTLQVNPSSDSVQDYALDATVVEDGILGVTIFGQNADNPDAYVGDYTIQIMDADGNQVGAALQFTVTASDDDDETESPSPTPTETETASPSPSPTATEDDDANEDDWTWNGAELKEGLNLEADRVTPQKFVTDGVAFAVRGCEPGQDVTFEVSAGNNVNPYTATVSADENGIAVHGVKGLDDSQPDAYIGEYTVTATCGDNTWNDSFTVGYGDDDANPGDDDSDDNGSDDNGSDLPRTGTELTGLAAGAGLLVLGAATVLLTRRKSAKTGPADI